MFQGKKCLEKFIERISLELEKDPINFINSPIILSEEEEKYMLYDNFPESEYIFTLPDIIKLFIDNMKSNISDEMISYYNYMVMFKKIIGQLDQILKAPNEASERLYSNVKKLLHDVEANFYATVKNYRKRNDGIRRNRKTDKEHFQKFVDDQVIVYNQKCDQFEAILVKVITAIPAAQLKKLIDVLRNGLNYLNDVYDLELKAKVNSKGKVPIFYVPERLIDLKIVINDYLKPLLFQLSTTRKRSLMYKPPFVDYNEIVTTYSETLNLFPLFLEMEEKIKPSPITGKRQWSITVFPTGRMTSPYTRAITGKGKETRMCYGFYFHQTNVFVLSGTADEMTEEGEPAEIVRVFLEYIFDTISQNVEYIRDPIGIGKEKGNYYSIIKNRLNPELSKILEDTLDLRYHFTEDLYKFISIMKGETIFTLPDELYNWFMITLVDEDYIPPKKDPEEEPKKGMFGFLK